MSSLNDTAWLSRRFSGLTPFRTISGSGKTGEFEMRAWTPMLTLLILLRAIFVFWGVEVQLRYQPSQNLKWDFGLRYFLVWLLGFHFFFPVSTFLSLLSLSSSFFLSLKFFNASCWLLLLLLPLPEQAAQAAAPSCRLRKERDRRSSLNPARQAEKLRKRQGGRERERAGWFTGTARLDKLGHIQA